MFCFGQKIRNLDRICQLVKLRCDFSEYSISSPTKRVFYPNWPLPKRYSFFLCKITNIARTLCTQQKFAPKNMIMERIRRSIPLGIRIRRPQTASTSSSAASRARTQPAPPALCPHTVLSSPVPTSLRITVDGLYCTPTENLSRFCKIFTIFRINCFPVWNN